MEAENPNPAIETPAAPVIDQPVVNEQEERWKQERDLYNLRMAEQNAEIERLKNNSNNPVPPVVENNTTKADYWTNPEEAIGEIIKKQLAQQVAPLISYVNQNKANEDYNKLKQAIRNHPNFGYFTQVESLIDQQVQQFVTNGGQISIAIVAEAYTRAVGHAFSQGLLKAPVVNPTPNPVPPVIPPAIPSSSPVVPSNQPQNLDYNNLLTETEKKIARLNNMTFESYYKEKQENIMKLQSHGGK